MYRARRPKLILTARPSSGHLDDAEDTAAYYRVYRSPAITFFRPDLLKCCGVRGTERYVV